MKDTNDSSNFIKKFLDKFPIPNIVITEIIAAGGLYILRQISKLFESFIKDRYSLYYLLYDKTSNNEVEVLIEKAVSAITKGSINLNSLLWVLISIIILVAIPISHFSSKIKKYTSLKPQVDQYLHAAHFIDAMDVLRDYANNNETILSIQLYSVTPLPTSVNSDDMVSIDLRYKDGTLSTESSANVNAMLSMHYRLKGEVYKKFTELLNRRESYYRNVQKKKDTAVASSIHKDAWDLFFLIQAELNAIQDVSSIRDEHYANYRVLRLLVDIILALEKYKDNAPEKTIIIKDGSLLDKEKQAIEAQLISGQRTGVLGAILRDSLYHFGNDNSLVKKNRCYFATPIELKGDAMVMLVVLQKDLMRREPEKHCEMVYDEIYDALYEKIKGRGKVTHAEKARP